MFRQRFGRQRSAAVASFAVGIALASGLVSWEAAHDYSVRDLGPLAIGFAILLLAAVMYRVLSEIGGRFAGIALSLGASILIGWVLGLDVPINAEVIQTVTTVALIVGILALVAHRQLPVLQAHRTHDQFLHDRRTIPTARNDLRDLYRNRQLGRWLRENLHRARHEADFLDEHPERDQNIMVQLKRMLPPEGYLTERLATLRERAHYMRKGQIARIEEIRKDIADVPATERRQLGEELAARFKELKFDIRLERLDRACAEAERRIHQMTLAAAEALQRHDYHRVTDLLEEAEKLQVHNTRLFRIIGRTEEKLIAIARHAVEPTPEVTQE